MNQIEKIIHFLCFTIHKEKEITEQKGHYQTVRVKVIPYARWYSPFYWLIMLFSFPFFFISNGINGVILFAKEIQTDFSKSFDNDQKWGYEFVIGTEEAGSFSTYLYIWFLYLKVI